MLNAITRVDQLRPLLELTARSAPFLAAWSPVFAVGAGAVVVFLGAFATAEPICPVTVALLVTNGWVTTVLNPC
jgi:hypothetical protein